MSDNSYNINNQGSQGNGDISNSNNKGQGGIRNNNKNISQGNGRKKVGTIGHRIKVEEHTTTKGTI